MLRGWAGAGGRESQGWEAAGPRWPWLQAQGLVSVAGVGAACGVAAQEPRQPGPRGGA